MAQNFLYMFEFVVDDLLITRPNYCAPEEYPTCCEISFRSSVFVSICDREFGACVDTSAPKCGKCCLFSLEAPVADKDRLLIHIYKKKTDKCKFLVGATDVPIKSLFDKVTETFNIENPNWREQLIKHTACLPNPKISRTAIVDNDCDEDTIGRKEQMCPTSELTKRLLPLFNMKKMQTGNLVLIMRLVCNGPTIVSTFPFSKICSSPCGRKPKSNQSCAICPSTPSKSSKSSKSNSSDGCCPPMPDPCRKDSNKKPTCQRYFACNADKGCPCEECEDDCDRECPTGCNMKKRARSCPIRRAESSSGCSSPPDPCKKSETKSDICQRYFSSNQESGCSCNDTADECEADEEEEDEDELQPCFVMPNKPDPGPEAYDEFEASLNGSGLTIRVLKETHQVSNVSDGTQNSLEESDSDCERAPGKESRNNKCESLCDLLRRSTFARNHVKRRTGGHIINNSKLPKIRANIKYSGKDSCGYESGNYRVPFNKVKQACEGAEAKLNQYRKAPCFDDYGPVAPPKPAVDSRNCCLQVEPQAIKNALKGINVDTRKKGIEVCYKPYDDSNSDVFLVKLGSKHQCQKKKNSIEIELKTPKQPVHMPIRTVTTETQIDEAELDAALTGVCAPKKAKGKGKGKGKKK